VANDAFRGVELRPLPPLCRIAAEGGAAFGSPVLLGWASSFGGLAGVTDEGGGIWSGGIWVSSYVSSSEDSVASLPCLAATLVLATPVSRSVFGFGPLTEAPWAPTTVPLSAVWAGEGFAGRTSRRGAGGIGCLRTSAAVLSGAAS